MRKHGWQLPYHPLQVVAIAVFLALGFSFYVFFAPFVGKKQFEYVVMGLYTPLVACVFCLYIWCAAADPGDPGVFRSKKYLNIVDHERHSNSKGSKQGESICSINEANGAAGGDMSENEGLVLDYGDNKFPSERVDERSSCCIISLIVVLMGGCHLSWGTNGSHSREPSQGQQSEDGMFYCSLCEVEVYKYSKHCRVCDKCVDGFDHHCRWLNNCIGRKNYQRFFILMISSLLLLLIQCSIGVLVLVRSFVERQQFTMDISSKLGSSFSLAPFTVVVGFCTFLAIVSTMPLAQLFFFHVLLIKKGISTYDYIIALREQEHQVGGQQSPQMSSVSSLTGLSSASSFTAFRHGSWCTPPRLFLEDQLDVIPPDTGSSVTSLQKRILIEESSRKKNPGTIKISPWTLARLDAEEVSKAAAQARKNSRILQPVVRRDNPLSQETDSSYGSCSGRMAPRIDNQRRMTKRGRLTTGFPLDPLAKLSASVNENSGDNFVPETSTSLAPLQLEARSAFHTSRTMSFNRVVASSPDSSLGSPDLHSFGVSTSEAEGAQTSVPSIISVGQKGIPLSRSTSDGYEASGGEDSDRIPSRIVHRSSNWCNAFFNSGHFDPTEPKTSSGRLASQQ